MVCNTGRGVVRDTFAGVGCVISWYKSPAEKKRKYCETLTLAKYEAEKQKNTTAKRATREARTPAQNEAEKQKNAGIILRIWPLQFQISLLTNFLK